LGQRIETAAEEGVSPPPPLPPAARPEERGGGVTLQRRSGGRPAGRESPRGCGSWRESRPGRACPSASRSPPAGPPAGTRRAREAARGDEQLCSSRVSAPRLLAGGCGRCHQTHVFRGPYHSTHVVLGGGNGVGRGGRARCSRQGRAAALGRAPRRRIPPTTCRSPCCRHAPRPAPRVSAPRAQRRGCVRMRKPQGRGCAARRVSSPHSCVRVCACACIDG